MLEVTKWHYSGDFVVVEFSDSHVGYFEPYRNWGNAEGFRTFMLKRDNKKIFVYRGRESRHSFVSAVIFQAPGVSQQFAATYWELARKYFNVYYEANHDEQMWNAWITCCTEGSLDLERLLKGEANNKCYEYD